ncbi:MAG: MOSC domain-containing protein [Solirubrobacteraceae bacterium]
MGEITVTGLVTYPIKSCAGVQLEEARLTPKGLELDREFMLVDEQGDFLSQRKVPELALIVPALDEGWLTVRAPGMEALRIPLETEPDDSRLITATLHGKPVTGQVLPEATSEWFTAFLPRYRGHRGFRLLRVRDDVPRYISRRYRQAGASNRVGFADGSAMLLASEASLAALNEDLEQPVPMNRFRPNLIVAGPELAPYEEDHWTELQIGALRAFVTKPSDRCVTVDVDQSTAATGKAVRRALTGRRRGVNVYDDSNSGIFFAQNLNHLYVPGATLALGDRVEVLARNPAPNVLLKRARRGSAASAPGARAAPRN